MWALPRVWHYITGKLTMLLSNAIIIPINKISKGRNGDFIKTLQELMDFVFMMNSGIGKLKVQYKSSVLHMLDFILYKCLSNLLSHFADVKTKRKHWARNISLHSELSNFQWLSSLIWVYRKLLLYYYVGLYPQSSKYCLSIFAKQIYIFICYLE